MMRSFWSRFRKNEAPVQNTIPAAPMAETIQKAEVITPEIINERESFAAEHISRRLGNREMSLKEEWSKTKDRVEFTDEKGDTLCVIKWKDNTPEILDYVTGAFVLAANHRIAFSCARGERMSNDGSMAGKLASARSEVGGVMCTN
jgi:hypothetical protein